MVNGLLNQAPSPVRPLNTDAPAELEHIKALEKKRDARYQSASELRKDPIGLERGAELGEIFLLVRLQSRATAALLKRSKRFSAGRCGLPG
jgi:hypothetical protein